MEVLLIRHGRTAGNIEKRYAGRTDDPLCEEGIDHAHRSGKNTELTHLYVSPLKRAIQTAQIKFPNARHIICSDLREMDFGDFEGRSAEEMVDDPAYIRWVDSQCTLPCPNGEQIDEFSDRVCRVFDSIVREGILNGEDRLVIVAHGGSIMAILSRFGKPERTYYDWYIDNCCGFRAQLDETSWEHMPSLINCSMFETLE